jgi:hypothetical protein
MDAVPLQTLALGSGDKGGEAFKPWQISID